MSENNKLDLAEVRLLLRYYVRFGPSAMYRLNSQTGEVERTDPDNPTSGDILPLELRLVLEAILGEGITKLTPEDEAFLRAHADALARIQKALTPDQKKQLSDFWEKLRAARTEKELQQIEASMKELDPALQDAIARTLRERQRMATKMLEKWLQENPQNEDEQDQDQSDDGDSDDDYESEDADDGEGESQDGDDSDDDGQNGEGQQGEGQPGEGQGQGQGGEGSPDGEGQPGEGSPDGESQPGEGQGQGQGNYEDKPTSEDSQKGHDKWMEELREELEKEAKAEEQAEAEGDGEGQGKGQGDAQEGQGKKGQGSAPDSPPNLGKDVEGTFSLSDAKANPEDVAAAKSALARLISRGRDNPTAHLRWKLNDFTKRMLSLRPLRGAKKPTLERKAVLFIIDNSPSMAHLEEESRRLAAALSETKTGALDADVIVCLSFNGHFSSNTPIFDATGKPILQNGKPKEDGAWYLNGKIQGQLPKPTAASGVDPSNHGACWMWFVRKVLPRHGLNVHLIGIYGDYDGVSEWCFLSNELKGLQTVWFNPTERGQGEVLEEHNPDFENRTGVGSLRNDDKRYRRFRGRFFLRVDTVRDIATALKKTVGL